MGITIPHLGLVPGPLLLMDLDPGPGPGPELKLSVILVSGHLGCDEGAFIHQSITYMKLAK